MSALTLTLAPAVPEPADRQYYAGAVLMLVLAALALAAMAADPRLIDGVSVWSKPLKFALALAVHLATLGWVAGLLPEATRRALVFRLAVPVVLFCAAGEMAYIILQAARQEPSHFFVSDPFHAAMYQAMGVGAVTITLAALLPVPALLRPGKVLGPGLRRGLVLGLAGGAVLTLLVAGWLGAQGGHFVGTPAPGSATVPLFGWSLGAGDLRPAHFLALHAMQGLPLIGAVLDRLAPRRARAGVTLAGVAWAALTLAVFARALAGLPLL
ncbi:hypothetical protein [Oceanicella sp. SM1341]|uniref:hypothetical protein n=1 Tax=Oceanicella sp. SM1341 TaxID=1548889 RepID=UPI000E48CE58|nr:hypothetical protein [Oceanicella sp. SM1341]